MEEMAISVMIIDRYMPEFDISKSYATTVSAPVHKVYSSLKNADINDSPIIRVLFLLRGLPMIFRSRSSRGGHKRLTISDMAGTGFILLDERPNEELVIGVVGQFWKLTGNIRRIEPKQFTDFSDSGYAKATWNFSLKAETDNVTLLTTETRVHCTDEKSRERFRSYWGLIGPFSGLIRKEMLKIIKRESEK